MRIDLLAELSEAHGTSGREDGQSPRSSAGSWLPRSQESRPIRSAASAASARRPGPPGEPIRLMLAAHMDEIGLMVTGVDDQGYLRVIPLGGWDARTLVSQRVVVHGRETLTGMVGVPPVHTLSAEERTRAPKVEDLRVDLGLPAERIREVVRPGDVVTRARSFAPLGDLVSGKALDDRVGVFVLIEAMRAAGESPVDVLATATVQEEVGLRGHASTATRQHRTSVWRSTPVRPATGPDGAGPAVRSSGRAPQSASWDASAIGPTASWPFSRPGDRAGHSPSVPRLRQGRHRHPVVQLAVERCIRPAAFYSGALRPFLVRGVPSRRHRRGNRSRRSARRNRRTASRPRTEPPYPPWTDRRSGSRQRGHHRESRRGARRRAGPRRSPDSPRSTRPASGRNCATPDASVPANRTVPWQ